MKKFIIAFVVLCICQPLLAQNEVDALRYSWTGIGGTARYVGMGGAFGALGADFSTLSTNPAGIAMYRRSELTFTPGFVNTITSSTYETNRNSENEFVLNVNNLGLVATFEPEDVNWIKSSFGVGYNHQANFNQVISISGRNSRNSIANVYVEQANGTLYDDVTNQYPFASGGAWETFIIDPVENEESLYQPAFNPGADKNQILDIERSGSMGEVVLSFGGNFRDKLYMGMTVGIPRVRFEEERTYREIIDDPNSPLRSFEQTDELETSGSGVNVKAGLIYRVSPWLRVGAAAHTPTWLTLSDIYSTEFSAQFEDEGGDPDDYISPAGSFDYRLRTPARFIGSAAFLLGKRGLISADYEYVDYSQAKLSPYDERVNNYEFELENETIDNLYRSTHNVRVGIEWRVLPPLKIRGGVMYQQSPYVSGEGANNPDVIAVSGGIGYRGTKMHINLSYSRQQVTSNYYMYDSNLVSPIENNRGQNQLLATLGWFL